MFQFQFFLTGFLKVDLDIEKQARFVGLQNGETIKQTNEPIMMQPHNTKTNLYMPPPPPQSPILQQQMQSQIQPQMQPQQMIYNPMYNQKKNVVPQVPQYNSYEMQNQEPMY